MNRNFRNGLIAISCMLILILDSKTAVNGAVSGIEICLKTVIPSLFPFFVISNILTSNFCSSDSCVLRFFSRVLNMPAEAAYLLIPSFFGGYPVGAQCIGYYYNEGYISKNNAEKMLGFCNNSGPSFIFGMLGNIFSEKWIPWTIWSIHIVSAVLVSRWFENYERFELNRKTKKASITHAVLVSANVMGQVCAWVVLFRIVLTFLNRWVLWLFPTYLQILIQGIFELTNGCIGLVTIGNINVRFILCTTMLSLGGLCVALQTASVTPGLSLKNYYWGKFFQASISALFAAAFTYKMWHVLIILMVLLYIAPKLFLKKVDFFKKLMYNVPIQFGRKEICSFEKR